jgi:hypothetical protein
MEISVALSPMPLRQQQQHTPTFKNDYTRNNFKTLIKSLNGASPFCTILNLAFIGLLSALETFLSSKQQHKRRQKSCFLSCASPAYIQLNEIGAFLVKVCFS